jgi:2-polyprenyl-3-methyl-5-hydroxy-6-metoxy-1,4-benzoquinol methylase
LSCELVYLSDQSHIDNGHYENSGMFGAKIPSVEYLRRDTLSDNERRYEMLRHLISNKSVLDFGCGSGGFIQKAQNIVSTIEGVEIEERMYGDLREKNRMHLTLETVQGKFDVITAFHVIEHLKDPREILKQLREKLINEGVLIIEVPSANDILASLYDCEEFQNFTYWSQHLYLFNQFTLKN